MLLNIDNNAKTYKGQKQGYLTGILYLAPANESGYETCPGRSKGCTASCLFTAGRGVFENVKAGRIAKTKRFFEDREYFMYDLAEAIDTLVRRAETKGLTPCVRLNGTSDIDWERVPFGECENIMEAYPDVQFYDYTKRLDRGPLPDNYHLTFSRSESNGHKVSEAFAAGMNVAIVFEEVPTTYQGVPVISGDDDDLRFLDPECVVVGLKAKGKARQDDSGFVVRLAS